MNLMEKYRNKLSPYKELTENLLKEDIHLHPKDVLEPRYTDSEIANYKTLSIAEQKAIHLIKSVFPDAKFEI